MILVLPETLDSWTLDNVAVATHGTQNGLREPNLSGLSNLRSREAGVLGADEEVASLVQWLNVLRVQNSETADACSQFFFIFSRGRGVGDEVFQAAVGRRSTLTGPRQRYHR